MIKTVVFDIGCVLIGFPWDEYVKKLFEDPEVQQIVTNSAFKCPYWKELDRGEMQFEDILAKMIEQAPEYEAEIREAVERVGECTIRNDFAIPWIEDLKSRGYQVLYLSNYSDYVISKSQHALDFLDHVDGGVFSYKVGEIKPDDAIYWELFKQYNLDPMECVFIDDVQENLDTAFKLGMTTILFETYPQAKADLDEVLAAE